MVARGAAVAAEGLRPSLFIATRRIHRLASHKAAKRRELEARVDERERALERATRVKVARRMWKPRRRRLTTGYRAFPARHEWPCWEAVPLVDHAPCLAACECDCESNADQAGAETEEREIPRQVVGDIIPHVVNAEDLVVNDPFNEVEDSPADEHKSEKGAARGRPRPHAFVERRDRRTRTFSTLDRTWSPALG